MIMTLPLPLQLPPLIIITIIITMTTIIRQSNAGRRARSNVAGNVDSPRRDPTVFRNRNY